MNVYVALRMFYDKNIQVYFDGISPRKA